MRKEPGSQVRPRLLYARTTWKKNSAKFAVAISGVSSPIKPPSSRVERDHPRSPPHVATNGARKRSKLLRLATGRLPENFGVLRSCAIIAAFTTISATALVGSGRGKGEVKCSPKRTRL